VSSIFVFYDQIFKVFSGNTWGAPSSPPCVHLTLLLSYVYYCTICTS
jgi:hypothetical protein